MATVLGTDKISYQPVEGWAKLPEGWRFKECAGVAVDSRDRVYVFSRGEHPVMVFDREGNFLTSWGEGLFGIPHGITVAPDDSIYCVDNGDHTVRKLTNEGELLMTLGREDHPPPRWSGVSFNQPTHLAVSPKTGDLYISDGYGNSRIHKYSPEGQHILSWGTPGIDPGQFVIPHNIAVDEADNVYVADRENHRMQIFDTEGNLQQIWGNTWKPTGLSFGPDGNLYIAELGGEVYYNDAPDVGHRVSVYTLGGDLLTRLGDSVPGEGSGQFLAPHGIALDSRGDMYVAEVSFTMFGALQDPPREMRSFQKLVRIDRP